MRSQPFELEHDGDKVCIFVEHKGDDVRIGGTYVENDGLALKLLSAGAPNWLSALDCSAQ